MQDSIVPMSVPAVPAEQWLAERTRYALGELADCIEVDPRKLGGVPVVRGTRVSVAQILAEIGEGESTEDVAEDLQLDPALIKRLVTGLAVCLDRVACQ